jgi:hypothetical protein
MICPAVAAMKKAVIFPLESRVFKETRVFHEPRRGWKARMRLCNVLTPYYCETMTMLILVALC